MNERLRDLKKQLVEAWRSFESRLLESHSFNLLKERYQSLSLNRQRLIKYGFIVCAFVALAYLPLSYFSASVFSWREFKGKQNLSLELLRMRGKLSSSLFRHSQHQLKSKMERVIEKYSSVDFKIEDKKKLFSKKSSIYQIDFGVQLKHLNIKQAIKLGTELNHLPQSRLRSVVMEESKEFPKHYDVAYQVSSFASERGRQAGALFKRKKRKFRSDAVPSKKSKTKKQILKKSRPEKNKRPSPAQGKGAEDKSPEKGSSMDTNSKWPRLEDLPVKR